MTHGEIFGGAQWIGVKDECDAAFFRKTFIINKAEPATITICGLGYFELYINGNRVSEDYFVPANSDYHERPDMTLIYPLNDKRTHRIYAMQYDVSRYIEEGKNIIGIAIGGGFYHQTIRKAEGNMSFSDIKLCFNLKIGDEEILSDESIEYNTGIFKKSNLFVGEELDYTGFDRKWNTLSAKSDGWQKAVCLAADESEYFIQDCPTDKIIETLDVELVKDFGDYSVYKTSKNISGYPVVRCDKAGEKVVIECAEEIFEDGNINNLSVGWGEQRQIETYITDGAAEEYHPYFCWFGFRYFSLTNNARPVCVRVIHADIAVTSDFNCSDETLNWYHRTYINTQLCNMHGGVPSDCPHRERLGYTGDGQLTCGAVMTQMDAESFYRKWIYDIIDCQDRFTGHVQHTAPFAGGGGGPAGWGGAIIIVPYEFYRHYGDKEFLKSVFPRMELFVKYMESRCEGGLVVREEKDGWCLGDWCTPAKVEIPEPFVNTTMYISQLRMMIFCAKAIGFDTAEYEKLIEIHSKAVYEKYYDCETGSFLDGLQGADSFALSCGIADEKSIGILAEKYDRLNEFDTGIFGTDILLNTLSENGKGETAVKLLANKNDVSFETMRKAGATTLWENWNGEASHSHPMFGAGTKYLFERILGIMQTENSVRYNSVKIEPVFADFLHFASGYITTPHGKIAVSWHREDEKLTVDIDLCDGIDAVFVRGEKTIPLFAGNNTITL